MGVGVRTQDLRKVFHSAPPMAAGGMLVPRSAPKGPKPPKNQIPALDGVSLEIRPGEIFGLLGPNGAGKSTTIGILTTRTQPTSGRAFIGEYDVWQQQVKAKRLIGVVPQRPNLDFSLTAREILIFHGAYFGQTPSERDAARRRAARKVQAHRPRHSNGARLLRRHDAAPLHRPRHDARSARCCFSTSPAPASIPQTRLLLWEIIREYNRRGKTIVLTTHNMDEADALCERLAIIDHGRIIAQGTPAELKASIPGGYLLRLRFDRAPDDCSTSCERCRASPKCAPQRQRGGRHLRRPRRTADLPRSSTPRRPPASSLRDVHISEPSLENLFLHHTGRSLRD